MSETINLEDIKKTQNSLIKYIKNPPLTEKLLRKPPFRFLHDIIKSIIKETGFLSDIFTVDDLNLDNIKDKDGKIAFLKKLIAAVKDATGSAVSAKPNKIVAGLEVNKTLELLQAIGKGVSLKQSGKLNPDESKKVTSTKQKPQSTDINETKPKLKSSNVDGQPENEELNKTKSKKEKLNGTTVAPEKKRKEKTKKKDESNRKERSNVPSTSGAQNQEENGLKVKFNKDQLNDDEKVVENVG